ncbi:esterase/lipase family protein [Halobacillus hunanensis]|uniref:esterase/lipase family protein n=1 Tax=Halobacillus hunanensis TaxID=578214 RepID=UPI0009A6E12E|nr:hypothetical protein [Halobacillus hunanensis]
MVKKAGILLLVAILLLPLQVYAGSFGKGDTSGTPGQWYVGLTPTDVDSSKSPVVFVHGLNSSSHTWWKDNDMYQIAYNHGFETAFINLYPTKNMWDNGKLLAEKLKQIYEYFGEELVVVAHSKGGIDAQSALVHYQASPYVDRLITLSTPHHGSQLADLAYSSWAGWLADILGSKNPAVYSLQTGYMNNFRSQTDSHANVYKDPIFTFGGTGWGTFGTSLYWGGLYLSSYGANDGAVTVANSRLPYAQEVKVADWNHSEIRLGSSTFRLFDQYLYENQTVTAYKTLAEPMDRQKHQTSPPTDRYYRGGTYKGSTSENFAVENHVTEATVNWISERENTELTLIGPDGNKHSSFEVTPASSKIFQGAYHHSIQLNQPAKGEWTLQAASPEEHYLLSVHYQSPVNQDLDLTVNKNMEVSILAQHQQTIDQNKVKADIRLDYYKKGKQKTKSLKWNDLNGSSSKKLAKLGEGTYNLTINLKGITKANVPFNRTIVTSVYIDSNGRVIK